MCVGIIVTRHLITYTSLILVCYKVNDKYEDSKIPLTLHFVQAQILTQLLSEIETYCQQYILSFDLPDKKFS